MKTTAMNKTAKLSIELFNPQLLKETKILNNDDFFNDWNDFDEDLEDFNDDISAMSFIEFEKTLN